MPNDRSLKKTALHKNNPNRDYYMPTYRLYTQRIN